MMWKDRLRVTYRLVFSNRYVKTLRRAAGLETVPILNPEYGTFDAARRHRSFDSMSGILWWLYDLTRKSNIDLDLEGKDAMELGTGKFLAHAVGLYVSGCRNVVSVDKFAQLDERYVEASMEKSVLARRFLSNIAPISNVMRKMESVRETKFRVRELERIGITYRAPYEVGEDREYQEKFDWIISYTVLEHVPPNDISSLLSRLEECLKPGGVATHYVDLEDHKNPESGPFEFLGECTAWTDNDCGARGNRLRLSSWKALFEQSKSVVWTFPYIATRDDEDLPEMIAPVIEYSDEEDLRTTAFVAVGCKKAD